MKKYKNCKLQVNETLYDRGEDMENQIFENVDCVSFYVDDLEKGMSYYIDKMGLKLIWKTHDSCGLGMDNDITEVVLTTEKVPAIQFKVNSVEEVLPKIVSAGGKVIYGPFHIDIGLCAVISDPWNNSYCILDMTNGTYQVDTDGNVTGVK